MRKLIVLVLVIAISCVSQKESGKSVITVSILPQKYFVEKITGDFVDVEVLIPPGASPATYELLPSQMKAISKSAVWMRIGHIPFEHSWHGKIKDAAPGLNIVDTSLDADLVYGKEVDHGDHVHLHGIDPHIWMSPTEVAKIAKLTYKALVELFPEKEKVFSKNHQAFQQEIKELDSILAKRFEVMEFRKFLIFHPAFTYLARDYDLEQIPIQIDGKDPSPQYLSSLVDIAKADSIKMVFIQKEFDRDNATQIAKEIGGKVVQLDPLRENWREQLLKAADKLTGVSE